MEAVLRSATSSPAAFLLGQGPTESFRATVVGSGGVWSHNDYLEFLITGGIGLMAVLYTAMIVWLLVSMLRLARDARQSSAVQEVGWR